MITVKEFGKTKDGKEVSLYSIKNSMGMQADVTDFGAILVNLFVPTAGGDKLDVVLGYDKLSDYETSGSYFGATIGPSANRIKGAKFTINGTEYSILANENGNNLHSDGEHGFHKVVWDASVNDDENSVTFSLKQEDGALGFPGNRTFTVTYKVTDDGEVAIIYTGASDKDTVMNLTNHTYFNLDGHDSGSMEESTVMIKADRYTEIVPGAIPTGNLPEVAGTPMDLTSPHKVSEHCDDAFEQLVLTSGYDHNYVISKETDGVEKVAEVMAAKSGIIMEVYTDLPGIQFYAGNFIDTHTGKGGASYARRMGLCLETQYFPNAINEPAFESPVFGPNKPYKTTTIYKFI